MRHPRILTRFTAKSSALFLSMLILLAGYNLSASSNSTAINGLSRDPVAAAEPPAQAVGIGGGKTQAPTVAYTVNSLADTNSGSGTSGTLRFCINAANTAGGTNTITFSVNGTITLTASLPNINNNLTIDGPGPSLLTINGNNTVRVISINTGFTVTFQDLTIANGRAVNLQGGAIDSNNDTVTLSNCVFDHNFATFDGGAVRNNGGNMTVTGCTFSNNTSAEPSGQGGGLKQNGASMTVTNTTFINNSADAGGGFHIGTGTTNTTLTNCTFYGNTATFGGAVEARASGTFQNCTFTRNVSSAVGGINVIVQPTTLINTIVSGNLDPNGNPSDIEKGGSGTVNTAGSFNNLIGTAGSTGLTNGTNGNQVGILDPKVVPPANYGGPVPTVPIRPSSPARNAGRNTGAPATDARGFNRPQATTVDIGAFEIQTNSLVTNTLDSGAGSMRNVIAAVPAFEIVQFESPLFDSAQTISLSGGQITLSKNQAVVGPAASLLTVQDTAAASTTSRAFLINSGVTAILGDMKIANNTVTAEGGAIANQGILTLRACVLDNNSSVNEGGGIANGANTTLTVIDSTISNNSTTSLHGGGIGSYGAVIVTGSTFVSNSSSFSGGGIALLNGGGLNGSLTAINSTFSANQAAVTGAGIYFDTGVTTNTITNCTITLNQQINSGSSGGGIGVSGGTVTLKNTIVANNTQNSGAQSDITTTGGTIAAASSFNLIGTGGSGGLTNGVNNNQVGVADAKLIALGNYGGPTQTHLLSINSPAINAGTSTGAPTTDQRGVTRSFGGTFDIGAIEAYITVTPASVPTGTAGVAYPGQTFSADGGSGDYTFALIGTLPNGMFFSPVGADISGTPTQGGSFPITVTATDNTNGFVGASSYTLTINVPVLHHFAINTIPTQTAGTAFNITITAKDASNVTVTTFTGTVNLSTTAGTITPTTSGAFSNGVLTQSVTVTQSGAGKTISVNDGSGHTATSNTFTVNVGALHHFAIGNITTQTAGAAFNISLTAQDLNNNTVTSFNGTVGMSTTAGTITPTTSSAFTSGTRTQSVTVAQAGTGKTISVNDSGGHTGTSNTFTVGNTYTWNGSASSNWNTAANWTPATVPSSSNDVDLPASGVTNNPTLSSAPISINNLIIAAGRTLTLSGQDLTINGALTLSGGTINTGSNTLNFGSSATISRSSGQVIGNLKKTFSGAGSFTYAVGTANGYSPIDVTVTAGSGDLTIKAVQGAQPDQNPAKALQRYWTLTGSGLTVSMTFNYLQADVMGSEATYQLFKVSGGITQRFAHNPPAVVIDTTANTAFISGVTSFSDWTLGEPGAPTAADLALFTATGYDGGVFVEWQTGNEVNNLGFNLYREQAGRRSLVNAEIIAGSALKVGPGAAVRAGYSYGWWDKLDQAAGKFAGEAVYYLEDLDLGGHSRLHGPFQVKQVAGKPPSPSQAETLSHLTGGTVFSGPVALTTQPGHGSGAVTAAPFDLAGKPAIKMIIKSEGWYRVSQPELAAAGFDVRGNPRNLQLFVDGVEQPMLVVGESDNSFDAADAIEFYGTGQNALSSDAHMYWLGAGAQAGKRVNLTQTTGKPGGGASYLTTIERRERSVYFSSLLNGETENFFGRVIASQPVEQPLTLPHVDANPPGGAELEIALQGVTELPANPDHVISVALNGVIIGQVVFDGREHKVERFSIAQSLLREGDNQITLSSGGGASDISLVDYLRVSYWHSYTADGDQLRMTASDTSGATQTIEGFSSPMIRVFDITDAQAVTEIAGLIDGKEQSYGVTVAVTGQGRTLLALSDAEIKRPAALMLNRVSALRSPGQGADLVIVTRREFSSALTPLVGLRQSQGLSVAVVEIEDVYDEFNYGEKTARALKDFLAYTQSSWKKKPRFVLLAGDASFDARDYLGLGDFDMVPTKLIDTVFMETASDDWLADFNNDGVAELAVGRLPVRSAGELSRLVAKQINYERRWPSEEVLLAADQNDGFSFEAASDELRGWLPAGLRVNAIYRGQVDPGKARAGLLEAINRGQKLINYTGHGSVDLWRGNLLTNADGQQLNNRESATVFVLMTCLNGYFDDPALDSLAETLLKAEGGAVAVWASSGMCLPGDQATMNQHLYRELFSAASSGQRLGEAVQRAKAATNDADVRRTFILLGDPTMKLR
jgi:Peptidase family C25/Right handed beta helix region